MRRVPCLLALATLGLLSQLYSTLPEASPPPATAPAATGAYVCDLLAFGAKGDGHTDNTEAFRRALRSCGGLRKERRLLLERLGGLRNSRHATYNNYIITIYAMYIHIYIYILVIVYDIKTYITNI